MKNIYPLIASLILATGAFADTEFPRGSFGMGDLEKAKVLATTQKKEISFIYTDKASSCGLCQNAAEAYIRAVKSKTVIVHVNSSSSKEGFLKLPQFVQQALTPGKFIPKIVVTDSAVSKVCTSLTYEAYKEDEIKSIRSLKKHSSQSEFSGERIGWLEPKPIANGKLMKSRSHVSTGESQFFSIIL